MCAPSSPPVRGPARRLRVLPYAGPGPGPPVPPGAGSQRRLGSRVPGLRAAEGRVRRLAGVLSEEKQLRSIAAGDPAAQAGMRRLRRRPGPSYCGTPGRCSR